MADGYIGIDEPTTIDKRADTEELSVGGVLVHRERIQVSGAADVAIATVGNSAPASSAYGLTVREVQLVPAAGAIAKAEDSASASADVGVPAIAIRKATPANTSDLDGDYEMLQMSAGRLWVSATIDAALPAGTNAIGKLAANDGVDIGDVTINNAAGASAVNIQDGGNSITVDGTVTANAGSGPWPVTDNAGSLTVDNAGTFAVQATVAAGAATIGKAEDAASADADVGVPAMAVRKATPANTSSLDGDYEMLQMSAGRLWTSATIDAALPAGANAIGKLAANDAVDIGDVTINNASGASAVNIQDGGNSITVDGTVTANAGSGTFAVSLAAGAAAIAKAEDVASADADVGVPAMAVRKATPANTSGTDGDYEMLQISAGRLWTSATIDAAPTGASAIQVQGTVAHDSAAAQNPVPIAGVAETQEDTAPTVQVSAEGDVTRLAVTRDGTLFTVPHPPRIWHVAAEYTTAQTDTSLKAAPGAGLSLYITDIYIACNAAVTVTIEESTTTLKFRYYAGGQGDGVSKSFVVPIKITANTAITVTTSGAVTVTVVVNGYTAP